MRLLIALTVALLLGRSGVAQMQGPAGGTGTIKGHVKLMGKLPGNSIIRMAVDPMCGRLNAGKRVIQETVAAAIDGSLANVVVKLVGPFPKAPAPPATPATIDQHNCIYAPRVIAMQVGQTLQIKNSDMLLHNVHSLSSHGNAFNVGQPTAGMLFKQTMKAEDIFRVKCDLHPWMTAYVAVVPNPYFAVTDTAGNFEIKNVPPGTYQIQTWHERYGPLTEMVRVRAGAAAAADFSYSGNEKAPVAVDLLNTPDHIQS
jgi:plastocyanin